MTASERIEAALTHRTPDRTPIWEKLIKSPVADELLGRPCAATNFHYRMERWAEDDWEGWVEQAARDEVELAEMLGFDMIRLYEISGPPTERPVRIDAETWRIGELYQRRLPSGWIQIWTAKPTPVDPETEEAAWRRQLLEPAPDPSPLLEEAFQLIRTARRIMTEKGLALPIFCAAYTMGVATLPEFMLRWFVSAPELVAEYYRRQARLGLKRAQQLVAEGAAVIGLGGDFASDHGPLCRPEDYRRFIAENIRFQADALHALGVWTTNASDGNLWPVIDDFLRTAGVDGFEEIDYAAGMDLAELKRRFPEKTFIGNIDIRHLLTRGTPEQVRAHTIECIEKGWGGGGHILMSSNCIHEHVKTELFLAYLNAYRDYFGLPRLS